MGFVKKAVLGRPQPTAGTTVASPSQNDLVVIYRPKPTKPKKEKNNGIRQNTG